MTQQLVAFQSQPQHHVRLVLDNDHLVFDVDDDSDIDDLMQSYPARALDRRLQEDWARDAREGLRVLMSLRVDFGSMS